MIDNYYCTPHQPLALPICLSTNRTVLGIYNPPSGSINLFFSENEMHHSCDSQSYAPLIPSEYEKDVIKFFINSLLKTGGNKEFLASYTTRTNEDMSFFRICFFEQDKKDKNNIYFTMQPIKNKNSQIWPIQHDLSRTYNKAGVISLSHLSHVIDKSLNKKNTNFTEDCYAAISIDGLSELNTTFGYHITEAIISDIGELLQSYMRSTDVIGYISGVKFGICFHNCTPKQCLKIIKRYQKLVRSRIIKHEDGCFVTTISAGIISISSRFGTASDIISKAEEALANAKRIGGCDSFAEYQDAQLARLQQKASQVSMSIVNALQNERILLHYQPIIDLKTNHVRYYEALARMQTIDGQLIVGGQFIPTAEGSGLIRLIDQFILRRCLQILRKQSDIRLSVNISAYSIKSPEWINILRDSLETTPGIARNLIVEITETAILTNMEEMSVFCETLHKMGCKVAIDDFGSGYTSYRNIRYLSPDIVKIDGSYIRNIHNDTHNQFFIRMLADLCKRFNALVTAEQIETKQEHDCIKGLNVDLGQGHLYGKPAPDFITSNLIMLPGNSA